jgi:RimJ/RimL family protein N-acetyltransferase
MSPATARLPDRIESSRLVMRCYTEDDAEVLAAAVAANIEHLRSWMPWIASEPLDLAARTGLIRTWDRERRDGGGVVYGMFRDGELVGGTGFHRRIGPAGLEIGYWTHRDHLRRGYATEAAEALTTAAFGVPGIERVEIHHDRNNVASAGVPARLGFSRLADTRRDRAAPGDVGVQWAWVVWRSDWLTGRPSPARQSSGSSPRST